MRRECRRWIENAVKYKRTGLHGPSKTQLSFIFSRNLQKFELNSSFWGCAGLTYWSYSVMDGWNASETSPPQCWRLLMYMRLAWSMTSCLGILRPESSTLVEKERPGPVSQKWVVWTIMIIGLNGDARCVVIFLVGMLSFAWRFKIQALFQEDAPRSCGHGNLRVPSQSRKKWGSKRPY